jgi:iron complex transport system substrate-binding protein
MFARLLLAWLSALLLASATAVQAAPRRIVSLNMCADQLLLRLADRNQIAALTDLAGDRWMSAERDRAKGLKTIHGAAEDVLALDPDLIVASPGRWSRPVAAMGGRPTPVLELNFANSYGDIIDQIRMVAKAVGHPGRGEALIARMAADLAAIPRTRRAPVAAYYQRRGYLTGQGTLIDDLMRRVGIRNLATILGKPMLSRMSVEEMVAAQPDFLIVETTSDHVDDQGTEMLHHRALAGIPRLRVPEAWTICGGPAYVLAARTLAAQLRGR